ncbi:MAG: AraC family transcriptional regulator [Bacteroidales bacterium]|nr:AraC family transcriptional regulator [Bacteroidales bacterium]
MTRNLLTSRFEQLFFEEKAFLEPGLTLQPLAARLFTNKTYLSRLINDTYHLSFPELLNTVRVDYAQRYMREHPGARQDEIARASGFLNAPTFSRVFKRIAGTTPKTWAERGNL